MAINGSFLTYTSNGYGYFTFDWTRQSFSNESNTSTIGWTLKYTSTPGSGLATYQWNVTIDGQAYSGSKYVYSGTTELATGTTTIAHNSDGTKTFSVTVSCKSSETSATGTKSYTLDPITRASGVTCTTVNIGVAPVITINSQNSAYKHTLTYGFGNQELGYITGTIATNTTKTTINDFVWPASFYQVIPNSTEGSGVIYCTTYDSAGRQIGDTTQANFIARANEGSSTPVLGTGYPLIKDINTTTTALTGNANKLVRYFSTAQVTIGAQGRNYATIARQKVKNGTNYHEEYTNNLVTIAFANVASPIFSFELEDSRGYTSKPGRDLSATGNFIEYFHPSCAIGNNKPNLQGECTITCNGSWFNQSFGSVANTLTTQYRFKLEGDAWQNTEAEWKSMTASKSGNSYDASATFTIPNFDYTKTYVFQTRAKDKLFTAYSIEYPVKSLAIFSWSDQDFEFNVPVSFNAGIEGFEVDVDLSQYALKSEIPATLPNPQALTINNVAYNGSAAKTINILDLTSGGTINGSLNVTGDLRLKGSGNYGNTLRFGDGDYVYFQEQTDDALTIKATTLNLIPTTLNLNGKSIAYGSWTPALNSSAISSYTTQSGWYQKLGSTVTIGFNIKATCKSGYHTTGISISGVPFAATDTATGGGMCSGTYVAGGYNFQCWAVSSSAITARVQSCNNNTDANLPTSASGCYYRTGGGEITLSGTITYLTNS